MAARSSSARAFSSSDEPLTNLDAKLRHDMRAECKRLHPAARHDREALDSAAHRKERWCEPELLRINAEVVAALGHWDDASALFRQSLAVAQEQGALSWELRTATSLAPLLRSQGRPADAIACLQPVYDRFTEGFGTADLIAAKQLLDELSDAGRR